MIQCQYGQKEEAANKYKSELNLLEIGECLGYIEIPKIKVYLPIYEGTTDEILLQGIGHLRDTSFPMGGKNTNSVLVGHTGITAKTFFDRLNEMELGDVFYIYVLDEKMEYKVKDIKIVLPDDTEGIKTKDNTELVTLVTCTPKYINSHRLLVIGESIQKEHVDGNDDKDKRMFLSMTRIRNILRFLIFFVNKNNDLF